MDNDAYLKSGRPCHCRLRAGALLKKDQPGFAFLLSLCGAAGLLWFAVQQLRPLLARLQQLAGQAGGDSFSILLQVLAIAFVAQLAADLCREAGLAAAAFCMEFVGRILAMLQALPLLQSLLASFLSFYRDSLPAASRRGRTARWGAADFAAKRTDAGQARSHYLAGAAANAGWLAEKRLGAAAATGPARGAVLLLSSCVGLLADGGAWRDCVDLVAVLGFGTIALNQMTSLVQQVAQAANTSQLYVSGFVPVFAGVALLAGQTAGAAVYSTMFYAMAAFLAEVLQNLLLPLLQIYFCFSVSAALWGIVALPMPQTCLPAVLPLRSNCAVCCLPLCWGCKMCWPPGLTAQP